MRHNLTFYIITSVHQEKAGGIYEETVSSGDCRWIDIVVGGILAGMENEQAYTVLRDEQGNRFRADINALWMDDVRLSTLRPLGHVVMIDRCDVLPSVMSEL